MKIIFLSYLLLSSLSAFAFYGEFQDNSRIPDVITSVEIQVYNAAKDPVYRQACNDNQCYRMDVILNGRHVATWATSPGKRHEGTNFVGNYSPVYNGRSLHPTYMFKRYTNKYGDPMPYAMFMRLTNGGVSPIAFHCGNVTGKRESHGCFRMVCDSEQNDAATMQSWVKEAFANGGTVRVWTQDVYPSDDPR